MYMERQFTERRRFLSLGKKGNGEVNIYLQGNYTIDNVTRYIVTYDYLKLSVSRLKLSGSYHFNGQNPFFSWL